MPQDPSGGSAPVLVVGGGVVGLSAALFLQHHGVSFILVERNEAASSLPRARGFSARTLELFRSVGLQDAIEAAARTAWEQGQFGGARRGATMVSAEPLPQPDIAALHGSADPSPCDLTACPQTLVELVLREALAARGGDVRFGWEMLRFEQDDGQVEVVLRDPTGAEKTLAASYLFAADGARGDTSRTLDLGNHGTDADRHYLNIFFTADLTAVAAGRTFSQCEIANDGVSGVFLAMNNTTQWSFHLAYNPATDEPQHWSDARVESLVKAAIGIDVPVTLHSRAPWNTRVKVADHYGAGRVFLLGDAAHSMPPWGGFNANAGIADAHNLAWKVAHVLAGGADSSLLDTYDEERRPVSRRNGIQARLRTDFNARFQIRTKSNAAEMDCLSDYGALQMRYRYGSDDTVDALSGQPGTRFPHAWIDHDGRRRSTLDLFGTSFVGVGGSTASDVVDGTLYRAGVDFHFKDEGVTWQTLTGLAEDRMLMVRPDGVVHN